MKCENPNQQNNDYPCDCGLPLNLCLEHEKPNCRQCPPNIGDYHYECYIGILCPVCHNPPDYCPSMWHHTCPECRKMEENGEDIEIFLEEHPENSAMIYYGCSLHNYYPTPYKEGVNPLE